MAQTLGELLILLKADSSGLQKGIKGAKQKMDDFGKSSGKSIGDMVSDFKALNLAGVISVGAVIAAFKVCVTAAMESEEAVSKLNQVLRSTGGAAGVSSKAAQDLADSLQAVTTFDDEAILSGQTLLLTFTRIGKDVFPQATEAMLDMSTMLGQDVKTSAIQLGKALNDPIQGVTALRRVGIQLSDQQQQQIKSFMAVNDVAGAQKIILAELSTQMGGQAREATETLSGKMAQTKNNIGQLKEYIGSKFIPIIKEMVDTLNSGIVSINKLNTVRESIEGMKEQKKILDELNARLEDKNNIDHVNEKTLRGLQDQIKETTRLYKEYDNARKRGMGIVSLGGSRETNKYTKFKEKSSETKGEGVVTSDVADKQKAAQEKLVSIITESNIKIAQSEKDSAKVLVLERQKALDEVARIELEAGPKGALAAQQAKQRIYKEYNEKIKQDSVKTAQETLALTLQVMTQMTGQLSGIFNQYMTNKNMEIDNYSYKESVAIAARYETDKANIEATVTDEREKAKQLKALDEKRAREEKVLAEKVAKDKRKAAREAAIYGKGIAVTSSIINTALAISGIMAHSKEYGLFAIPLAAMVGALAAAQTALILAQPLPALAKGGLFQGPAIIGEKGREMALPLEGQEGRTAMREMASGIMDVMASSVDRGATVSSGAGASGSAAVYLDGRYVGEWLNAALDNGQIVVPSRVVRN